ncbi:cobalamin ABC transporter substrate-binding protein [Azorhizobium oxalatiphilum]|uniref:Cobalamin ABC transporter substrate-binding protein n=1 Tax=Azorhizobium oxalatiphilum TaxID=980631 RepID=A0A917C4N3_9HYPH|nr:ABC transporter substrate-binding protein [Azorhizobium oxalatiphilum]GGF70457.1 cobalamin ABC transporter substrate-binding protein [Azorhizobium oxalatiphilum]
MSIPRRRIPSLVLAVAGLVAASTAAPAQAPVAKPQRIVSLNLCADELLVHLADRDAIASLTYLARDARGSTVAREAAGIPINHGLAEEIVPLKPDLVIAGVFTTRNTVSLLKKLGVPLLEIGIAHSPEEAAAQIRTVAERIGEPARGERLASDLLADFARLPPVPANRPTAVVVRPNGFTAGGGSMVDAVMTRAGLDNIAGRNPADRMGQLSVEQIVIARPDVLITDAEPGAPPSLAQEVLRHPALAAMPARKISVPGRLWACAGPELAQAAAILAAGAREAKP